jgi:hypothetical protein
MIRYFYTNLEREFQSKIECTDLIWIRNGILNEYDTYIPTRKLHPHLDESFFQIIVSTMKDNKEEILNKIKEILKEYKYIIVSENGVSSFNPKCDD